LKRRRFFAPSKHWQDKLIILDSEQTHHLKDVLRVKIGESIICFDETGRECCAEINSYLPSGAELKITDFLPSSEISDKKITIAQSIIKPAKMDFIVQKTVELGIDEIIPFRSSYCSINLDEQRITKKSDRWNKISIEASKQCGRKSFVPVKDILDFDELIEKCCNYDKIVLADQYSGKMNISGHIENAKSIIIVIGPEGGFTEEETKIFSGIPGCVRFNFNENILRAETAAVAAVAIIKYELLRIS